jgi:hypothetical protein
MLVRNGISVLGVAHRGQKVLLDEIEANQPVVNIVHKKRTSSS